MFAHADILLFKDRKYKEAETIYNQILQIEREATPFDKSDRNTIDALNSLGYCIKFRTALQDLIDDSPVLGKKGPGVFTQLKGLYEQALTLDGEDVEANFNLAGLYLQRKEPDSALRHFQACVMKDQ